MDLILPFKAGDLVESRSFTPGFRGAWFRSKISLMCVRQGHLECLLEYIDFPDEKKTWTRLYKIRPGYRKQKSSESRDIMIRPTFPKWYWENQIPDQHPKTDFMAIVSSPWQVGDLIEWWYTECYWSGKIIELFGHDKVKIVLHEPPIGEGGLYDADCKNLRPALEWSLEKGWSVPLSQEDGKCWYNACLIIEKTGTATKGIERSDSLKWIKLRRIKGGSTRTLNVYIRLSCKTDTGNSSSDEENEPSSDGREEVRKCLNVPADMPAEVMETGSKLPANTNDEAFVNNQGDSKEEALKCLNGTSEMPREITNSNVNLSPNQNTKRCTGGETGHPIAEGRELNEALLDVESSSVSLKRWKISIELTSDEVPPDTVDDNIVELEKVAKRIRRLENLMPSVGSAPSSVASMKQD